MQKQLALLGSSTPETHADFSLLWVLMVIQHRFENHNVNVSNGLTEGDYVSNGLTEGD